MCAPLACCVPHLPLGLTDTMACLQLRAFRAQLAKRAASIQRSMHDSRAAASPRLSHHDLSRLVVRGSHIEPSDVSFADAEAGTCTCRRHHARVNHSASAAGVCVCVCVCVCGGDHQTANTRLAEAIPTCQVGHCRRHRKPNLFHKPRRS